MTDFIAVIPARFASTRLPGKPLLEIAGKSIVQRAYEQAKKSGAKRVIIATDDARIEKAGQSFGAEVFMTSADHVSGTTRIAEVVDRLGCEDEEIIVNVQGDEPLIPPENIQQVAANLAANKAAVMATLCERTKTVEELFDPNVVKVEFDKFGYANTFSRAPILWERGNFEAFSKPEKILYDHFRHIGIYSYRAGLLRKYATLEPSISEQAEKLEQLRILWHGEKIHVALAARPNPKGIDTQEDLDDIRKLFVD